MSEQTVILYSTGCPQCKVLKAKLDAAQISYEVCSDVDAMKALGITSVPMLNVNGALLGMKDAMVWIKEGA